MTQTTLCGEPVSNRGILASLWFLVQILALTAFLTAFIYVWSANGDDYNYDDSRDERDDDPEIVVSARSLAFCTTCVAILSALLSLFGTVVLGWQSPSGQYYTCCSSSVHRTTPLGLGSFIGALLMLANLTLICSVLFGEFTIRDNREEDRDDNNNAKAWEQRSTMAFSVLCMVLTLLYAGFAALTFSFAQGVIEEHEADELEPALSSTIGGYDGYIGERFDVVRPSSGQSTLA